MKKLLMTVAVLACAASVVSAQVTSANVVGYNKNTSQAGLQLYSLQFFGSADATPTSLFGDSLPVGSKLYIWANDGAGGGNYSAIAEYIQPPFPPGAATKWDSDPVVSLGDGFWINLPSGAADVEGVFAGDVLMDATADVTIEPGLQLVCNPYPCDILITDLGITPTVGDKLYVWTNDGAGGGNYTTIAEYIQPPFPPGAATKWDNTTLVITVGQGFWYKSNAGGDTTLTWTAPPGL